MRWGHVVSTDLVTWVDTGIALEPDPSGADADGAWSGSARIIDGRPVFFYTGARGDGAEHQQSVLRAVPTNDELTTLRTDPREPVLQPAPAELGTLHQRDPYLLWREGVWWMLLGTGLPADGGGAVAVWESADTLAWTYRGILFSQPPGGEIETGPVWECPQLVEVDGRWVLLVSVQERVDDVVRCLHVLWFIGDLDGATFAPTSMGIFDHGDCFYATAVAEGTDSPVLWGWLQDVPPAMEPSSLDHVGALSLPRQLALVGDEVAVRPAPELGAAWTEKLADATGGTVQPGAHRLVADDLPGTFRVRVSGAEAGLRVGLVAGGDARSQAAVWIGYETGDLATVWVTCRDRGRGERRFDAVLPEPIGPLDVEVVVDEGIVEVFAGGRAFSFRWAVGPGCSVLLRAPDEPAECRSVEVHGLTAG
jgi:beta-fructofuranosidase